MVLAIILKAMVLMVHLSFRQVYSICELFCWNKGVCWEDSSLYTEAQMHGILPLASCAVGPLHLYRLMAPGPVYLSSPIILSLYASDVNIFESSNEYIFGVCKGHFHHVRRLYLQEWTVRRVRRCCWVSKGTGQFPVCREDKWGVCRGSRCGARILNINTERGLFSGMNSSQCHHQEIWYISRAIVDFFWSGKHSVYVATPCLIAFGKSHECQAWKATFLHAE